MIRLLLTCLLLLLPGSALAYRHFEARQQNPICLTPDGKYLLALQSPAATLSIFALDDSPDSLPVRIREVVVGIEPVSVRARTDDEVWVVNEVSDSISVVSLSQQAVIATLYVPDEPADVAFANGKAFVTCSRNRMVRVFDASSRTPLANIPIQGISPGPVAAHPDGTKVYVACTLSGNRTTVLPSSQAPAQPAPTRPGLPSPPRTALIVPASDSRITWNVLDHDIAEIDTSSHLVLRWFSGIGTHLWDLAFHPDGSLWCPNSESLNLTRFEPELRGDFIRHQLTRLQLPSAAAATFPLNPGIVRSTVPNPAAISVALAHPTQIAFHPDGARAWICAFQSDRIAEISASNGQILHRWDLRPEEDSSRMRGPRGIALHAPSGRLFVLNKLSDTIITLQTDTGTILDEFPVAASDPMPATIRQGRGYFYDARLSGNGTLSCASCHIDADHDGLAWDLGNPDGEMVSILSADLSIHDNIVYNRSVHPMKGPMVTQTLRGLSLNDASGTDPAAAAATVTKFHWRGDKPSIQSFNATFPNLLGGRLLASEEMDLLAQSLLAIVHHPNPHRNLDRTLKTSLQNGNPVNGRTLFNNHTKSHCLVCHGYNGGTDQNLDLPGEVGRVQPIKNPPLRLTYQKAGLFNPISGQSSLSGFGFGSDGSLHLLPKTHPYTLDNLSKASELNDVTSFLLSYDTGTPPALGYPVTVPASQKSSSALLADIALLESRCAPLTGPEIALVVSGTLEGRHFNGSYDFASGQYLSGIPGDAPLSRASLLARLQDSDTLLFLGVPAEDRQRLSGDRNGNGIADLSEPPPDLRLSPHPSGIRFLYDDRTGWFIESSLSPGGPWDLFHPRISPGYTREIQPLESSSRFFRLRREDGYPSHE